MRKILLFVLVVLSIILGYSFAREKKETILPQKTEILKFAILADSHNDNDLLAKALDSAKSQGASFVIGLGDYTNIGTVDELKAAKEVFDKSGLTYYATAGDHDLWDSRNRGQNPLANFNNIFGKTNHQIGNNDIQIDILDNSDIYRGMDPGTWSLVTDSLKKPSKLRFVMAHKTPFHPDSKHIMGAESREVAKQADRLIKLIEENKVDGFFSGDLHFFAKFQSPSQSVKITTVGAVTDDKNFQGPRFGIVKVYGDYSWEVEDLEIR